MFRASHHRSRKIVSCAFVPLIRLFPSRKQWIQLLTQLTACRVGDMITNDNGHIHQYFVYSPFGENMYQYNRNSDFNSRYRFNGKEIDSEPTERSSRKPLKTKRIEQTGNGYYGARYYDPKISVWLSVDPWAYRYPSQTPYNFVFNNPIRFIDPTGKGPEEGGGFFEKFGNWISGDGWNTNQEVKQNQNPDNFIFDPDNFILDEVVLTPSNSEEKNKKKHKNEQNYGEGQFGDLDEQVVEWPKGKKSGDYGETPVMRGAPGKAGKGIIEQITNGINLFKKWYNWHKQKDKPQQVETTPTAPVPEDPKSVRDLNEDTTFYVNKYRPGGWIQKERTRTKAEFDSLQKANEGHQIMEY